MKKIRVIDKEVLIWKKAISSILVLAPMDMMIYWSPEDNVPLWLIALVVLFNIWILGFVWIALFRDKDYYSINIYENGISSKHLKDRTGNKIILWDEINNFKLLSREIPRAQMTAKCVVIEPVNVEHFWDSDMSLFKKLQFKYENLSYIVGKNVPIYWHINHEKVQKTYDVLSSCKNENSHEKLRKDHR